MLAVLVGGPTATRRTRRFFLYRWRKPSPILMIHGGTARLSGPGWIPR